MEMRAEKLQKSTYTPNFNQPHLAACRYHKTCSGQYILSSKTESACIKHNSKATLQCITRSPVTRALACT